MEPQELVTNFLNTYYGTMISNRETMINFYRENSCLSYEGDHRRGLKDILEKFRGLSFKNIQYNFENHDFQPSPMGGLLVAVNGKLLMDGENNFAFFQVFHLMQDQASNWFLSNDIFRLEIN